jgi:hypothetical protein
VGLTIVFTSFCSELAKDLKKFLASKIRMGHSKIRKELSKEEKPGD